MKAADKLAMTRAVCLAASGASLRISLTGSLISRQRAPPTPAVEPSLAIARPFEAKSVSSHHNNPMIIRTEAEMPLACSCAAAPPTDAHAAGSSDCSTQPRRVQCRKGARGHSVACSKPFTHKLDARGVSLGPEELRSMLADETSSVSFSMLEEPLACIQTGTLMQSCFAEFSDPFAGQSGCSTVKPRNDSQISCRSEFSFWVPHLASS
jgi:hypothetical protein